MSDNLQGEKELMTISSSDKEQQRHEERRVPLDFPEVNRMQAPANPATNLGFLHKLFNICFPGATAIFLSILVTFALSSSDALSDIALSYFLYSR